MCGVIGFISAAERKDLGIISSKLLRMLEYRGYDSTGAAIQGQDGKVELRKGVGSPTEVTKRMDIYGMEGRIFCGQVRWATFGAVTQENAQPHDVWCKVHLYGAHNGNITNCDQLKSWLEGEGHSVKSDNDGEMLVHTVEHFFAQELAKAGLPTDETQARETCEPVKSDLASSGPRVEAFRRAIVGAAAKMIGSFAAVVVDPVTAVMACIKAGSSLYMGLGHDPDQGVFSIVSSDLGSVLSMTKILVPLKEREFVLYTADEFIVCDIRTGAAIDRKPMRSRLGTEETRLREPYKFFMEQEIGAQAKAGAKLIDLFAGRSPFLGFARRLATARPDILKNVKRNLMELSEVVQPAELPVRAAMLVESREMAGLVKAAKEWGLKVEGAADLESSLANFIDELAVFCPPGDAGLMAKLLDTVILLDEVTDVTSRMDRFVDLMVRAYEYGSSIYLIACGTSFHAAKTGAIFFDTIPGLSVIPLLPGEFRSQNANSIRNRDVVIGISQSGETKDLIDIFNLVEEQGKEITRISIVNNTNSSLAQEKSELYIPLCCGPEIAVPATKSFMNQLIVMYILALKVGERFAELGLRKVSPRSLERYWDDLFSVPDLIERTISSTAEEIDNVAKDLHLEPSIHILATGMLGIAKEGALKIREVVLNHTEGFEGSEFKHGPNTILGVNTVFGLDSVRAILDKFSEAISGSIGDDDSFSDDSGNAQPLAGKMTHQTTKRLFSAMVNYAFHDRRPIDLDATESRIFEKIFQDHDFFESLYSNYPLIFVSYPTEHDVNLTISQINTHKIRGANIYLIAEENPLLGEAVSKVPKTKYQSRYRWSYVKLPTTGRELLPIFSATVVLQLLALKMSVRKMDLLDRLEIADHGVHPDSPKNVSKSITVD